MIRCLFIGGPKDGQWVDVPEQLDTYVATKMAPLGTPTILKHEYRAVAYYEAGALQRIFVDKGIHDAHLFGILVKGYRR